MVAFCLCSLAMLIAFIQPCTMQTAQMHLKITLLYFRYLAVWMHKEVARDKLRHDLTIPLGQRDPSPLMAK